MADRGRLSATNARAAFALLVTATLVAACSSEAPAQDATREHRVAIIGDSFTEGSDEGGLGWRSWPAVMRHDLLETGVTVDLTVSAEGSAGYAHPGRDQNIFSDNADVLGVDDDLVIFFGGVNDGDVDPVGLKTAVHTTLAKAKTAAPRAKFIVIGPALPTGDPPDAMITVRDVIRDQANEAGIEFVDPIAEKWLVDAPELIGADGFHPTDRGHRYLAEKIAALVRNAFGGR
jgi:lysophospholipase L1-like esterase